MLDKKLLNQNIISALGLEKLADEKKMALLIKMSDLVEKRVLLSLLSGLNETDKKQLNQIDDPDEMSSFLLSKGINLEEIIMQETQKVREEALTDLDIDQNI